MSWPLQRFEPVGWAEEILEAVVEADLPQLPRLYIAASLCLYGGRPDVGVAYAEAAARLELDPRYDSFVDGWSGMLEALAHLFGGRINRRVEICTDLAKRQGFARVVGLCGLTWALPAVGRADEAMVIADETVAVAREYGSPFWIGWALGGYGRAFAEAEPVRALEALREGLDYAHRAPTAILGGEPRAGRGSAGSGPRRTRRRAGVVLEGDQLVPPCRQRRLPGRHVCFTGRVLRPIRTARDRRHHLRCQHPPSEHQSGSAPSGCRVTSPIGARRNHLRQVRRSRGGPRDCRSRPLRARADPTGQPRSPRARFANASQGGTF